MAFDRSKFKGAKVSTQKKKRAEAEEQSFGKKNPQWQFHRIESGKNIFRILPPHNPTHPSFQSERKTFLKVEVEKTDNDGNPTGEFEIKNKPIFIATVHGKDKNGNDLRKDPVELYIKYVYNKANDEYQDDKEKKAFLAPITGFIGKDGKFVAGIRPSTSYTYYALKSGQIGRAQFNGQIVQRMEEISIANQDPNEPDDIDIFSDPDEGQPLVIDYNPNADKGEKYNVYELKIKKGQSWEDFFEEYKVPDAILKEFGDLKPLKELYVDVYTTRDFDLALEGLQRVDTERRKMKNGSYVSFDIFENEEFLNELEDLRALLKEPKKTIKESEKEADEDLSKNLSTLKNYAADDEEDDFEDEDDDFEADDALLSLDRAGLKAYIKEQGLDIRVRKSYSDEEIREKIREKINELSKKATPTTTEDEEDDFEEIPDTKDSDIEEVPEDDISLRLAKLRNRKQ